MQPDRGTFSRGEVREEILNSPFKRVSIVLALIQSASAAVGGHKLSLQFLVTEWDQVADAWQLATWESYRDERHLLYVACTRARDQLLVTAVAPASEFLDDFTGGDPGRAG